MRSRIGSGAKKYLYGDIVDQIRRMIREGQLKVGDKLPPERTLADRFKVSRNCIRQAVQALGEKGILESRQGDGTYVCAPDEAVLTESLARAISMQTELLEDIWEFRLLMEPQIAFLAAKSITREQLDRLKVIVFDQQKKMLQGDADPELDAAFHRVIVEASGNRVVRKVMETMTEILNESRADLLQSHTRTRASVDGHFKIIDALERKDPDAAYGAMRDHLAEVGEIVWKSDGFPPPGGPSAFDRGGE